MIHGQKWSIWSVSKQPTVTNGHFLCCNGHILTDCNKDGSKYIICGDLSVNMLNSNNCIRDVLDVCGATNIVTSPTCYKGDAPTLLDIVITNAHRNLQNTICIECDLRDFRHMVCFATKQYAPIRTKRAIMYRSYKKFNEVMFDEAYHQYFQMY